MEGVAAAAPFKKEAPLPDHRGALLPKAVVYVLRDTAPPPVAPVSAQNTYEVLDSVSAVLPKAPAQLASLAAEVVELPVPSVAGK